MDNGNRTPQVNSIVRAFKLLEILKSGTDRNHKLTQEELLSAMKKMDGSCTLKTMRTDLRNLISVVDPVIGEHGEEYSASPEKYHIVYDGIEEGRHRISGIRYIHDFSNEDLDLLIELLKGNGAVTENQINRLVPKIKSLGSGYYRYLSDSIKTVPTHTNIDRTYLNHNLWVINTAICNNLQLIFTFNGYNREGKLIPVREKKYQVNPFYVVIYENRYYLLCTHGKHENVMIYRMDLMTDVELTEEKRESVRGVTQLEHSNPKEYMDKHLNMFYDEPRTIRLKVKNDAQGYTAVHDAFGSNYTFKVSLDDEYDEIEVVSSTEAIVNLVLTRMDVLEVIRPASLRKRVLEKAESLVKKYK